MTRKMTLTIEVTDEEAANFLARFDGTTRPVETTIDGASPAAAPAPSFPPAVQSAPPAAAPAQAQYGVELDKNGVPWLEAVHASTKAKTADGVWRLRKGVTKEQREAAEAAFKANTGGQFTVPTSLTGTDAPVTLNTDSIPAAPSMPAMPTQTGMPALPTFSAPPVPPVSFEEVATLYNTLVTAGKITPDVLFKIYADNGLANGNEELRTNETARRKVFDALQGFNQ